MLMVAAIWFESSCVPNSFNLIIFFLTNTLDIKEKPKLIFK